MLILKTLDIVLFCLLSLMVCYLLILGVAAFFRRRTKPKQTDTCRRVAVLFPAYGEDRVILSSVSSFLQQNYSKAAYDVIVISDHMQEETNDALRQLPIEVLIAAYENSSKAKALNLAMQHLEGRTYDIVVIMDADNVATPDLLSEINKTFASGVHAIQAHRVAKNLNTDVAVLDAVSEEINNSLFRLGTANLGFSGSLSGSGMAFDYVWFRDHVSLLQTAGEDRELEVLLLKNRIHVEYLPDLLIFDEKTQNLKNFSRQRKRWQAVQFGSLHATFVDLPQALIHGNFDYANKIIQWMLLPRSVMLMLLTCISVILLLFDWESAIKWCVLTAMFYLILIAAIPRHLLNKQLAKALTKIPVMAFLMCVNFFKMKEGRKGFIHTEHHS